MLTCGNYSHIGMFPPDCKPCHEIVLSVVKSKNISQEDYQIYLKNGGFLN